MGQELRRSSPLMVAIGKPDIVALWGKLCQSKLPTQRTCARAKYGRGTLTPWVLLHVVLTISLIAPLALSSRHLHTDDYFYH